MRKRIIFSFLMALLFLSVMVGTVESLRAQLGFTPLEASSALYVTIVLSYSQMKGPIVMYHWIRQRLRQVFQPINIRGSTSSFLLSRDCLQYNHSP